jgi:HlyD family secretion protein
MRASWRRAVTWILIGVLLAGGFVYAFWPQAVPVDLGEVARGPLTVTVDEEGETRVKEVYVVSAPLAGRVRRIESEVGDLVIADETVLVSIQETEPTFLDVRSTTQMEAEVKAAEAAMALAEAEVTRAVAELDFAGAELQRAEALVARKNISQRALERAQLEVKTREAALATAKAALRVKRFELEMARAALIGPDVTLGEARNRGCCVRVRSPISGRVLKVYQESEAVVEAGAPLIEIGDPESLEIVVDLLSADAVKVAPGAEVDVEDWGGGATLKGRVRRVEPYGFTKLSALGIEEQRVNVVVDFVDPPTQWQRLGHGYRVDTRIVVWQGADLLKVPLAALFRDGDDWAVFVLSEGRARLRPVKIGRSTNLEAQVLDGLVAGERVVLHPSDRIADDTRIVERPSA